MTKLPALLVLLLSVASCDPLFENPYGRRPFDSVQWKAYKDQRDNRRYEMLDDLVANHLPLGMERAAVLELLGPPETEDVSRPELMYSTGYSGGLTHIDPEVFFVVFTSDKLSRRYHIEG